MKNMLVDRGVVVGLLVVVRVAWRFSFARACRPFEVKVGKDAIFTPAMEAAVGVLIDHKNSNRFLPDDKLLGKKRRFRK